MKWPEVTAETPISEVMEIHRRIWDRVIENINGYKGDILACQGSLTYHLLRKLKPSTPYRISCVLCTYATCLSDKQNNQNECAFCPWQKAGPQFGYLNGLYEKFLNALENGDPDVARYWAEEIRTVKPIAY